MDILLQSTFTPIQVLFFYGAVLFFLSSLISFFSHKHRLALVLLTLGAFSIRFFMALLDPFLHEWDERFHALVAKNMMETPFTPRLWPEALLPYSYKDWSSNYIWVHKQPLFLWQMALSLKVFGVNEIALRLPSILMATAQCLLIARIGTLLHSKKLGYVAAFLFALSFYQLEMSIGNAGTDHNDAAFSFYVTASLWALAEYWSSQKKYWLVLIGLFSGMAILVKWLVGLLVYAGWGIGLVLTKKERFRFSRYTEMGLSLLVTLIVALPWQLYISAQFPLESAHEYAYNSRHLYEALEGHAGSYWFYYEWNALVYGKYSLWLIIPGLILLAWKPQNQFLKKALLSSFVLVYVLYTLAATKGFAYIFVINVVVFLAMGAVLVMAEEWLSKYSKRSAIFLLILAFALGGYSLRYPKLVEKYSKKNQTFKRQKLLHNAEVYRELNDLVPEGYVLFNCIDPVSAMFYCDRVIYDWLSDEKYHIAKEKGAKMAVLRGTHNIVPLCLDLDEETVFISRDLR